MLRNKRLMSGGLLVFTTLLHLQRSYSSACVSSCGKIHNISYPFRLKADPNECGDKKYELECINNNNDVVLRLFSGSSEFYVQSINYNNYTIRLVDPNYLQYAASTPRNCSPTPRHFLYKFNFSDRAEDAYHATQMRDHTFSKELFSGHVMFAECTSPIQETNGTQSCLKDNPVVYAADSDYFPARWVQPGCRVKVVSPTSGQLEMYEPRRKASYEDIERELLYGFEVSWMHALCDSECGSSELCFFNTTSQALQCCTLFNVIYYCSSIDAKCVSRILEKFAVFLVRIGHGMYTVITRPTSPVLFWPEETIGRYLFASLLLFRVLLGVIFTTVLLIYKWRRRHLSNYEIIEHFLQRNNLNPIRYSYSEIKKMTGGFKVKLGEGGFGSVYKGKLRSGPYVAIKMLGKSKANGQDFISEVATIGRIHHFNVVRLVGFCVEGTKRALVYEFMSNGSLDKLIFSKEGSIPLNYGKIYEISLAVARGIAYLHHGCEMQILHFDIKPHNILLDDNFTPKVADFGLAKLYPVNNSIVTLTAARGTIGYMAPELFYKNIGGVSYKADVYSFGKLLMEMASRRRNLSIHEEHSSQLYFPFWIYDQLNEEKDIEMENVTEEEKNMAKKMFIVALWCIQLKPCDRPSMNKVIEMLEGEIGRLEMPPKPSMFPCDQIEAEEEGFSSYQTESYASTIEVEMNHSSEG